MSDETKKPCEEDMHYGVDAGPCRNPVPEKHPCPYQQEINDDHEPCCNCCETCVGFCCDEV